VFDSSARRLFEEQLVADVAKATSLPAECISIEEVSYVKWRGQWIYLCSMTALAAISPTLIFFYP
jgi:hypothetical protein